MGASCRGLKDKVEAIGTEIGEEGLVIWHLIPSNGAPPKQLR